MSKNAVELVQLPGDPMFEDAAVSVRNLTKVFRQGSLFSRRSVTALKDVSFDLERGTILSIVGESGSGKSTIARILIRLEPPTSGTFFVDGVDIMKTQPRKATEAYRGEVQMVFQDPFGSLNPNKRVAHFLYEPLRIHKIARGSKAIHRRAQELMDIVGLSPDMLNSFPHQLSGGQRQRVAIARALAVEPQIILADEPTSMLDVSVRIGILNLMRRLCDEQGISIVYITHDLASARYVSDRTMVLYQGEIVEMAESVELMADPEHPYTQLLVSAVPDPRRSRVSMEEERDALRKEIALVMYGPDGTAQDPAPGYTPVLEEVAPHHWVRALREGAPAQSSGRRGPLGL